MAALPPGFVDVPSAISSKGFVSVIGVAVDVLPLTKPSRGTSSLITFTLKDCELDKQPLDGLKVKYFNDDPYAIPPVRLHDVILLRDTRVKLYQGKRLAVVSQNDQVPWAIFRPDGRFPICSPNSAKPIAIEQDYAYGLLDRLSGGRRLQRAPPSTPYSRPAVVVESSASAKKASSKREFSLIKDIKPHTFVDLVAQVVKTYPDGSDKFTIYVTDYTAHKSLHNYETGDARDGDPHGYISRTASKWKGPSGQMTILVTLWEPHASFAREFLKVNDFVFLTNVHIKMRPGSQMEGVIHTDRHYPKKIHVQQVDVGDDSRVKDLVRRKKEYEKRNPRHQAPGSASDERLASKRAFKKQEPNERKKQKMQVEEGQTALKPSVEILKKNQINQHVQAANPAVRCRSLEDIMSNESHNNVSPAGFNYRLPFQNLNYRSTVRVIDFFPPSLEDFSVQDKPEDSPGTLDETEEEPDNQRKRWTWRFCLLVESSRPPPPGEPRARMKLFVSGQDAVHLLQLDPTDLRQHPSRLDELRERLFILWGELEEQKRKLAQEGASSALLKPEAISSLPFNCCIKEYGVPCSHRSRNIEDDLECGHDDCLGWEQRFALFQTTIHY
ncbi:hypothetical protein ASPZODRAFT_138304 [Penicilliopsis zonata CBS 506.65]|uniref:Protection of telomeres protein 1 n=1 Tax=Penicilliopsis zonata CBS 506.65 TaxID=1073090 RepID=A0A1L9SVS8_9EURO|nr:hypothetical protein ASPZODRAFT_138304 [Penicilliopsis zonata CBS 506.65]OJJ51197.1 hypothetical protein ASPZODRAFT_138304 [Penicilliopsis zonata CBS 506.65]